MNYEALRIAYESALNDLKAAAHNVGIPESTTNLWVVKADSKDGSAVWGIMVNGVFQPKIPVKAPAQIRGFADLYDQIVRYKRTGSGQASDSASDTQNP